MSDLDVPYGFIKNNELYLSAWGSQPERRIGEIKEDGPASAVEYFQKRFDDLVTKIQELTQTIDATENKGSYLMKLLHLKELILTHEGLGDYQSLIDKLEQYEAQLNEIIQKNRDRNSEIKTALLIEAKEAVAIINWNEATEKVQDVKSRWLKTGNAKADVHEQLEADFWLAVQGFFERKKAFFDDKKRLFDIRQKKYEQLLIEARALDNLRGKERFDKVKQLKEVWGNVGNIPAKEYKGLLYQFNNLLKGRKEPPAPNFEKIKGELDAMYRRSVPVDLELLQRFRKNLGGFKTREPDLKALRHDLMQQVNLIWERDFLENLASKKTKGFSQMDEVGKAEVMKKLLREFIHRDKEDLVQYEENSLKFAGRDQETIRMLERKLGQQRHKITVKEKLLKILEDKAD